MAQKVDVEVYETENFPHSIRVQNLIEQRLVAGKRDGLSFFVEFYRLGSAKDLLNSPLTEGRWLKNSKGTYIHIAQKSISGQDYQELKLFRADMPCIVYGEFLYNGEPRLHEALPTLLDKASKR